MGLTNRKALRQIERGAAATSCEAHVACESEREDWQSQRQCYPEAVRWIVPSVWALGVQQVTIPARQHDRECPESLDPG